MANIYKYLRLIAYVIASHLFFAFGSAAMPSVPMHLHQSEFFIQQDATTADQHGVRFSVRAPPATAVVNVAITSAAVAEQGNSSLMHGREVVVASLDFGGDLDAQIRGWAAVRSMKLLVHQRVNVLIHRIICHKQTSMHTWLVLMTERLGSHLALMSTTMEPLGIQKRL